MTPLTRKVTRRTVRSYPKRRLVVSLLPGDVIEIREERRRSSVQININAAYEHHLKLAAGWVFKWVGRRKV